MSSYTPLNPEDEKQIITPEDIKEMFHQVIIPVGVLPGSASPVISLCADSPSFSSDEEFEEEEMKEMEINCGGVMGFPLRKDGSPDRRYKSPVVLKKNCSRDRRFRM